MAGTLEGQVDGWIFRRRDYLRFNNTGTGLMIRHSNWRE